MRSLFMDKTCPCFSLGDGNDKIIYAYTYRTYNRLLFTEPSVIIKVQRFTQKWWI